MMMVMMMVLMRGKGRSCDEEGVDDGARTNSMGDDEDDGKGVKVVDKVDTGSRMNSMTGTETLGT